MLRSSRLRLIATCTALLNFGSGGMIFALPLLHGVWALHLALVALGALTSASSVGAIAASAIGSLISLAAVIPVLRAPLRTLGDLPQGGD